MGIVINFRTRQILKDDENKPDAPKVTLTVPDTSKLSRKEQNDRIIQKLQLQKGK